MLAYVQLGEHDVPDDLAVNFAYQRQLGNVRVASPQGIHQVMLVSSLCSAVAKALLTTSRTASWSACRSARIVMAIPPIISSTAYFTIVDAGLRYALRRNRRTFASSRPYGNAVINAVPQTMSASPNPARHDSRSCKNSQANAIDATIESLSICTTMLTWPVCIA